MNATRKVKLKDISVNLSCNLCKGYMIDATTTIECLHSFCKSCIVKHLENSEYCPTCEVQLHSTKPLSGIRSDQMLQEVIFKLVPRLFTSEMERRRKFYKEHLECKPISQLDSGQIFNQPYITSDDNISISLEYFTDDKSVREFSKRYYKCSAEVSVAILKKLLQGKYDLKDDVKIDIMYGERILPEDFLLMDIAYKYSWTDSVTKPLQLNFRIKGFIPSSLHTIPQVTTTPKTHKRKSRSLTDSEVLKSSNINSLIGTPSTPKLTPNGKVRGRKKKNLLSSNEESPVTASAKKKKLSKCIDKRLPTKNFKETECQSDNSHLMSPNKSYFAQQKEVQLHISESGVIRAKSIASGEEKIIGLPDETNGQQSQAKIETQTSYSSNNFHSTTQINGLYANPNGNYIALNIPQISNGISPKNNGLKIPNGNGVTSPLDSVKKIKSIKRKLIDADPKKTTNGVDSKGNFESKKANVQKALLDLQMRHLISQSDQVSNKKFKKKDSASTAQRESTLNNNSQIHLPFPLAALASSGMTVNLIPSTDVKLNGHLQGKDDSITNISPVNSKKPKHHTTVVNGDLKFSTTPKHILPTPSSKSNSNGVISPQKPPKFFKSRHSPANNNSSSVLPASRESPIKEKRKSPTLTNGLPLLSSSSMNGVKCSNELNLINSTSSKKLNTTTTPSRMATPSATAVQSLSPFTQNPLIMNQLMQFWNQSQIQLSLPFNPIAQQFYPFVTNDFISMPLRAPTTSPATTTTNFSLPMFYANQNPLPTTNFCSMNINGQQQQVTEQPNKVDAPVELATDLSVSKKKTDKTNSLNVPIINNNSTVKIIESREEEKESSKSSSILLNDSTKTTKLNKVKSDSSIDVKIKEKELKVITESPANIVPISDEKPNNVIESKDGEPSATTHVNNEENKSVEEKVSLNDIVSDNVPPITTNGNVSPTTSEDSTDLVINEDINTLTESSPLEVTESNGISNEAETLSNERKQESQSETVKLIDVVIEEKQLPNGNHEDVDKGSDKLLKASPIYNNNNDDDTPAQPNLTVTQQKLTSESTTTGA